MKKLLLLLSIIILYSCNQTKNEKGKNSAKQEQAYIDSTPVVAGKYEDIFLEDTLKLKDCPVKIISSKPVVEEYSKYKDITVTYKNISDKDISAIKFKWYGTNAFGEPADMGLRDGIGSGFSDDKLMSGKSRTSEWSLYSKDLKKVVKTWAYEVVFEDGTKWKIE